jgi:DNA-binding NarL/FixJ family response regulator
VPNAISLVLVDDNVVSREAVASLIRQRPGFHVRVASADVNDALHKVREANARVVLLDSRLHNGDSLSLTVTVRNKAPEAKIIVTGIRPGQRDVTDFVRAGASGFIMKDASVEECLESIRVVTAGGHALPRRLIGPLFEEIAQEREQSAPQTGLRVTTLTKRERQVLALIGEGLGNKDVATRLHVAADTVRSHVANLFKKLGVRTRLQLAAFARGDGDHPSRSPR